jgi:predicted transporter
MKLFKLIGIVFMIATMIIDALELKDRFTKRTKMKHPKRNDDDTFTV